MKTINVRILVRNDLDPDVVAQQLIKGVVRVQGAVALERNAAGQLVATERIATRDYVTWNGEETANHGR